MHIDGNTSACVISPDIKVIDTSLSPEQTLSILRQARQLPSVTVARLELLHRVIEDGFSPDAYSIPEIQEITGHSRRQSIEDKKWVAGSGLLPQVQSAAPCSVGFTEQEVLEEEKQTQHSAVQCTALKKLQEIGWGRLGEYLISRWEDHARAYIDRHGAERVIYAIEYAEKEGRRRGEAFGPGWITCCLRNPEFGPPEDWKPLLVDEEAEEIPDDSVYREVQYGLIDREIRPFEQLLGYLPDEADRMRREWAGQGWLAACPVWALEKYRDWLWWQVEAWVKGAVLQQG
jgi:hypothetical protein